MKKYFITIILLVTVKMACAQKPTAENIQMPKIFSHHMVLQQQQPIHIFGFAKPKGIVSVSLDDHVATTRVDNSGKWLLKLPPMSAGGAYTLTVKGKNQELVFTDVLIGEVWFCSGQSNMEWSVARAKDANKEIADANYPEIRLFDVPNKTAVVPQTDLDYGRWEICSPASIADFSAVAYFFGRQLHKDLNVPVGLINASWGGTEVEAWTSLQGIKQIDAFEDEYRPLLGLEKDEFEKNQKALYDKWFAAIKMADEGYQNGAFIWAENNFDAQNWKTAFVPSPVEEIFNQEYDGITWFRRKINLTEEDLNTDSLNLFLGSIDDGDITFVNGTPVAETKNNYRKFRTYPVKSQLFKEGVNVIAVRIIDYQGGGGFTSIPDRIMLQTASREISLSGEWQAKVGSLALPSRPEGMISIGRPNSMVTSLYNGMVAPIIPYTIQGVIWYQGEANAGSFDRSRQYADLFPLMIKDWRENWGIGNYPFLFVQLANFLAPDTIPRDDPWPYLRESQLKTLKVPNTAMASAIDIGEENDIHPKNKQAVGIRLAKGALKLAYDKNLVYMGPLYQSMELNEDTAVLTFSHTGKGLKVENKYGYLMGFAVAGNDQVFHYAQAKITGNNKVKVWSDKVSSIAAVRYGWANNPELANLYNSADLPATPFRTDSWEPQQ